MNNYLLSIDPSLKNTGFTLWENKTPILIESYSFKKYNYDWKKIQNQINYLIDMNNYELLIERGTFHSKNGIGYETQEHLRGFIAGTFNKLLTKDMLISPSKWKRWYMNKPLGAYWDIKNEKWTKETSLAMAQIIIVENNWNIKISNHDEADSLLIGWYYLNKENK